MPIEQGYERSVAPGGTATGAPQAGADAFGAGIGAGVEQLGGALHGAAIDAYKIERKQQADQQATDFAAKFAKLRQQADQVSTDAQTNAAPGGAGHAQAMHDWWAEQSQGMLGGITEDSVRRRASEALDAFGTSFNDRAYQWQAGAGVKKQVTDAGVAIDTSANRVRTSTDPTAYRDELLALHGSVEAMTGIPADVRDKLQREGMQRLTVAQIDGLTDRGQVKAAGTLLDSGALDPFLTPEQLDHAKRTVAIEQRRQDEQVAHRQALEKQAVIQQKEMLTARLDAGDVPADAELASTATQLRNFNEPVDAFKLDVARARAGINRSTQPWTAGQYTTAIDQLEAKGDKRSASENVTLDQLRKIAPKRIDAFNKDTGSWAALNGMPRPALDLTDPGSIAATTAWRNTVATATGRPPPILADADARALAQEAGTNASGLLDVANRIAPLGGANALAAAQQVAPGNAMLARLTLLRPDDRAPAVNGAAARKAHPQLIDGGTAGIEARTAFDEFAGNALSLMPQDQALAAFEAARNIFADGAVKAGQVGPFADKAGFQSAAQRSLGGGRDAQGRQTGGIGAWNGAKVLLPSTLQQGDFDRALSRMNWPTSIPDAVAPSWAGGGKMTADEVRRFTPVARPDGMYEFHNARGEVIHAKNGAVWRLDIAKLATQLK